jgi:tRNA dimethylallyltransferase
MAISKPLICLMGPTASGKTAAAMALHDELPITLISVDSAQVYRHMNIGTGKPEPALLARYPHALLDIVEPEQAYSAAMFAADALVAVESAWAREQVPLLVGGTGLYYRALLEGLHPLPKADAGLRQSFEEDARELGWPAVHARLATLDPPTAARLHVNDAQRIQRALEVCVLTGKRYSDLTAGDTSPRLAVQPLKLIVSPAERATLHRRIEVRFRQMLDAGLVREVEQLRARPEVHAALPSMRSVGYRQVWAFLEGIITAAQLPDRGVFATRQLARRQLTWLRRERDAHWMDSSDDSLVSNLASLVRSYLDVPIASRG